MSWRRSKLSPSRAALAVLLIAGAASAAANVLVVRSSGPSAKSYPPGRSLPDNARISLRPGDTIVLLDARGTRTFRGPGNFTPSQAVRAATRTVQAPDGRRARIGAVRNAGIVPTSPTTIWHVDVTQSGTICLADRSNVMLWRPEASAATTLTISGPDGASRSVDWPAGSATLAWPADLPIAEGAGYPLRQAGVAVPTQVTFRALESVPADIQGVAEALIRSQCSEQLELLVATAPTQ